MQKHCCLLQCPDGDCNAAFPAFMNFMDQFRGTAGNVQLILKVTLLDFLLFHCASVFTSFFGCREHWASVSHLFGCRYIICAADFTVNPAKALLVQSSLHVLASVCAMGSGSIAHVQLPVCHKQTNEGTCTKHQRVIEDTMFKAKLCLSNKIALLYDRPEDYRGPIAGITQQGIAAVHSSYAQTSAFNACAAVSTGRIGPVALVKTSDFIDVDENVRPGPAERAEQKLARSQCVEGSLNSQFCF